MSFTQSRRDHVSGYEMVHGTREFRTLRRRFRSFAVPATVLFLCWYFLYVTVAAFAPGFMRIRVVGQINAGLCFGIFQFASTFLIAASYSRWARRSLDPLSNRLRERLERGRGQ